MAVRNNNGGENIATAFRNVSKYFGEFKALDDITLQVKRGEKIVVCGPSGSGKSTLIRCVNGLESISEGELFVDGQLLTRDGKVLREIRQRVGMVFQQFNLFPHKTVLENCILAPMKVKGMSRGEAEANALHYLNKVRVNDQSDKYPAQLSGGQQQRVAIARALAMSPSIMLFDEPTSALDPEMVHEVLETMTELATEGITMICVTHEMGFAKKVADRIIFMDVGRICSDSTPDLFFSENANARAREFLSKVL